MCSGSWVWCIQLMRTFIPVRCLNNKRELHLYTFVCCAVLRPSQYTFHVESVNEPTYTVHGQIFLAVNYYLVHMFSPVYLVCHL